MVNFSLMNDEELAETIESLRKIFEVMRDQNTKNIVKLKDALLESLSLVKEKNSINIFIENIDLIPDYNWEKENFLWTIKAQIGFIFENNKKSNLLLPLEIRESGIEISSNGRGSKSYYTNQDKDHISRDLLVANIWHHEEDIVKTISKIVIPYYKYMEVMNNTKVDIARAEDTLAKREREASYNEWLEKIKKAQFIASYVITPLNGRFNDNGEWEDDGPIKSYSNYEAILKITNKRVMTQLLDYPGAKKLHSLDDLIYTLQHEDEYHLVLLDERKISDPV